MKFKILLKEIIDRLNKIDLMLNCNAKYARINTEYISISFKN